MNKNILWGSIAVVVVVIFVWLQFSNGEVQTIDINNVVGDTVQDSNKSANTTKTNSVSTTIKSTPTQTFTNILPKVGNYQCDYEEVTQSTRSTNTVYLADGKMRAEFRSMNSVGVGSGNVMVLWWR